MPDASNPSALRPRDHPQDWIIEVDRIAAALHAAIVLIDDGADEEDGSDVHTLVLLRQAAEQAQELRDSIDRFDLARNPPEPAVGD